jgi:glycosyltransferase involved in cell wall biosynthesis
VKSMIIMQKKKIAIKAVQIAPGGGLTHLNKIIEWFGKLAPEIEFLLFAREGQENLFVSAPANFKYFYYKLPDLNLPAQLFWERQILPGLLGQLQADLLFEPGNRGTLKSPCPKVSLLHNVLPFAGEMLKNENLYNRFYIALLRRATIESMQASQGIIFISLSSRDVLARYFNFDSIKNTIIYHGKLENDLSVAPCKSEIILPEKFLLSVSHIHRYKKIHELVLAYIRARKLNSDIPPMLIAGTNYAPQYMNEIKADINKSGESDSIRFMGNVPEAQLAILYRNCEAFIFPSVLEACPNILIEALSCGCAIACSNKSVMPEIAGDAAIYFNPDNIEDFANIIISIVQNKKLKEQLSLKAVRRAAFFSWEKTARQTLDFFDEVLGKKRSFSQVKREQRQLAEAGQEVTLT